MIRFLALVSLIGITKCQHAEATESSVSERVTIAIADFKPYIDLQAEGLGWHSQIVLGALEQSNQPVQLVFYSWTKIFQLLNDGQICSYSWLKNPDREKKWQFSVDYSDDSQHLWGRKDRKILLHNINDIKQYVVGVTRSYSYGPALDKVLSQATLEESLEDEVAVRKLLAGRIDIMPAAEPIMRNLLASYYPKQQRDIESKLEVEGLNHHFVCSANYASGTEAIKKLNQVLQKANPIP